MDKSLFIFIAIGLGFLYFVTSFVGDIQEKDERLTNSAYQSEHAYEQYQGTDSIGQSILDVSQADASTQLKAWHASELKQEFLTLFPNYSEMKKFIKDRTRGDALHEKLFHVLDDVKSKFFSGAINSENAKHKVDSLK